MIVTLIMIHARRVRGRAIGRGRREYQLFHVERLALSHINIDVHVDRRHKLLALTILLNISQLAAIRLL